MREGEKLHFNTTEPSVVFMNPFGNPVTGYLYITDYKVYFKGSEGEQATTIQVHNNAVVLLAKFIISTNTVNTHYRIKRSNLLVLWCS